ncbi:MAG: coiled-coil domain-containing protein [Candidatus Hodarchaeales archaeon]|jgi:hypothetical protein
MSQSDIQEKIVILNQRMKKTIKIAYEKSSKLRSAIEKQRKKIKEDSQKLITETDPQLTEEGVKKITKKGKIYFRSLKAFNPFLHFLNDQSTKLKVPEMKKKLTSSELNRFIRDLSSMTNETNKERATVDAIMGLDFMLKKRGVYGALSKINSDLGKLRDLQKEEYAVIKAIEDLESLDRDVIKINNEINQLKADIIALEEKLAKIEDIEREKEEVKTSLLKNPLIFNSRQRGIRMTELEIELGKQLNSFKKIFKKYAREIQRGSISGEFGLVSAALAYEKKPVQKFLEESEENSEIKALLEELIKVGPTNLHLNQKNINNLNQAMRKIQQGKLNSDKKEWHELNNKKTEDDSSPEFTEINNKLAKCENEIKGVIESIKKIREEISRKEKEQNNLSDSLVERKSRSSSILDDTLALY